MRRPKDNKPADVTMEPGRRAGGPFGGGHRPLGMPVEKAKNFRGTLKRLLKYLEPRKLQLVVVLLTAVFGTAFMIWSPKIMGEATTVLFKGLMMKLKGIPGAKIDFDHIFQIMVTLGILYIISSVFSFIQQYVMAGVAQKTVFDMRRDVNDKLARLPLKYFDSRPHGEILSRVTNDIENISTTLQQSLTQLITSIITIVGILIMMVLISPLLTLMTLITLPLVVIIIRIITTRSQKYFKGQQQFIGELNGHVEEMYTGHKIVKAFGREDEAVQTFTEINERLYEQGWKAQFISSIIFPMMAFINNIGYVLICVAGGIMVARGTIQIGDVQAFIQYSRQFTMPINQTANIMNIIQSTVASAERVFEVLDEREEVPDKADAVQSRPVQGEVKFHHVEFSYKTEVPLIRNMSIQVKPGETIAIVGPTGAGKTTLVNLLMRFYEIGGGRITIDGIDIRDFKRGDLRTILGMVLQDTWLFYGTIKENIAYGCEGATDQQIIRAAQAAHADHFIRALPEGYSTLLNEEASNISQGEKQLLTIARAFLADPAILILDEATSSVDTRTEIYIQRAMKELMKGRTSFVIAHRLSTIREADLILVMNKGKIIETGTHKELLEKKGFYAELYQSQFAGSYTSEKATV